MITGGNNRNIGLTAHIARHLNDIIASKGYNIQRNGSFAEPKGGAIRTDFVGQEILQVLNPVLFSDRRGALSL